MHLSRINLGGTATLMGPDVKWSVPGLGWSVEWDTTPANDDNAE